MKPLIEFHATPATPKAIPIVVESPPETENASTESMPLDPEFLAWLEELL